MILKINNEYGRKKSLYFNTAYNAILTLQKKDCFFAESINKERVKRIVFVCKGNICRSAFAEYYAKIFLGTKHKINIESAGLLVEGQGNPSPNAAILSASKYGIELAQHKSKDIDHFRCGSETLFVGFEPWHVREIRKRYPSSQSMLLGAWTEKKTSYLQDPFGLSETYFENCYKKIANGVRRLLQDLRLSPAVLVCEVDTLGSIAVIRSLHRAGYVIIAASQKENALGFKSAFIHERLRMRNYEVQTDDEFFHNLDENIQKYKIECIIPSEAAIIRCKQRLKNYLHFMPLASDEKVVLSGMSKVDLFQNTSKEHCPPYLILSHDSELLNRKDELVESLRLLGNGPYFVKVDSHYSMTKKQGDVYCCEKVDVAEKQIQRLKNDFSKILVQGFVDGTGVGYFANRYDGKIITEMMHERLHEVPHTGGVSSYRRTIWIEEIRQDAIRRLEAMDWNGPAMVEYRVDENNFYLMEMNGRFWGSLHLALFAGCDFPADLVDHHLKKPYRKTERIHDNKEKKYYCRETVPLDIQHTWSVLKDNKVGLRKKSEKLLKFIVLGLNPKIHNDLYFPGDKLLYVYCALDYIKLVVQQIKEKKNNEKST